MAVEYLKRKKNRENVDGKAVSTMERKRVPGSFCGEAIMEMQKQFGNEATAQLLGLDSDDGLNDNEETVYSFNPIYSLSDTIRNRYFNYGDNLTHYVPALAEKESGDIPKQFMNLSLDTGGVVAGLFEGRAQVVLTAFLKNTVKQTVNHEDMRRVKAADASSKKYSQAVVLTNDIVDSAVSLVIDAAKGAKKTVELIQSIVENGKTEPTGIQTFDKVLPFLDIRKDKEKIEVLEADLEYVNRLERETNRVSAQKAIHDGFADGRSAELENRKSKLKKQIEEIKTIIKKKLQKKSYFIRMLNIAWKNLARSEEQLFELRKFIPGLIESEIDKGGKLSNEKDKDEKGETAGGDESKSGDNGIKLMDAVHEE